LTNHKIYILIDSNNKERTKLKSEYHLFWLNDNASVYINGIFTTKGDARENPDIFKFNTTESERGKV
jgi:hypothetical protein